MALAMLFPEAILSFTFSKWKETLGSSIKIPSIVDMMIGRAGYSSGNYLVDITVE